MSKKDISDSELIEGCLRGERKYQEFLYRRYSSKMYGVCIGYAKDRADAKDVLQDGFVKVFSNIHKYKGDGSFEGWIRRIIVNTAIDHYRKTTKEAMNMSAVDIEHAKDVQIEVSVLEQMCAKDIMNLIHQLPNGARLIFNLYVVEGYTHQEIAEKLNINQGTSKSQFARARKLLQELVMKLYNIPQSTKNELVRNYEIASPQSIVNASILNRQ